MSISFEDFRGSLGASGPSATLPPLLQALWHDAVGDWHAAHEIAQAVADPDGSWVHAYLHRKEGDDANAGYWYRRAGRPAARGALEEEWGAIAGELLDKK